MSATPNDFVPEAGVRPQRIEFVRETNRGETPSNPAWNLFSDHVQNWWDWEPEANKNAVQPAGEVDPDFTDPGSETHDATIAYWLQEWFVDGSGNALDASGDAMLVSSDNTVNNTHTVVSREEHTTQGGVDDAGIRVYHVGKGGVPNEVTVPFEVDNGNPIQVELNYQFDKFRTYTIDQPSSSTTLDVINNGTTSVDVTIENEGASTTETVTVAGGTTSTTTASFGDIDVVELSTDTDGDVEISDGAGSIYMTIQGNDDRTTDGDLGVPALGSGSHASAIGTNYVVFNDDTPPQWSSADIDAEWISGELNVSLNTGDNAVGGTSRRNIHVESREVTWNNTVAGPDASNVQVERFLSATNADIVWTADEGTVTGPNAEYFSPGSSDFEAGSGKNERSVVIQSDGITIS